MTARMTTSPQNAFALCSTLPIRQEILEREETDGIQGGLGVVGSLLVGFAVAAAWEYREEIWDAATTVADAIVDVGSEYVHVMSLHTVGECYPGEQSGN